MIDLKKCQECKKEMVLELVIAPNESFNRYICSCGYTELYDPFRTKYREEMSKYINVKVKKPYKRVI